MVVWARLEAGEVIMFCIVNSNCVAMWIVCMTRAVIFVIATFIHVWVGITVLFGIFKINSKLRWIHRRLAVKQKIWIDLNLFCHTIIEIRLVSPLQNHLNISGNPFLRSFCQITDHFHQNSHFLTLIDQFSIYNW